MKKVVTICLICFVFCINNTNAQINAYELSWRFQGTLYQGLLWFPSNGGDAVMRVRYYNSGVQVVEESFATVTANGVTLLKGYSPKFIYYENNNARYTVDNLVFISNEYGTKMYLLDDLNDVYNANKWAEIKNINRLYTIPYFNSLKNTTYSGY